MQTLSEPAGTNCAAGGWLLRHGVDNNRNNVLESGEITHNEYVCHGVTGATGNDGDTGPQGPAGEKGDTGDKGANGSDTLLQTLAEPAGTNCPTGGTLRSATSC